MLRCDRVGCGAGFEGNVFEAEEMGWKLDKAARLWCPACATANKERDEGDVRDAKVDEGRVVPLSALGSGWRHWDYELSFPFPQVGLARVGGCDDYSDARVCTQWRARKHSMVWGRKRRWWQRGRIAKQMRVLRSVRRSMLKVSEVAGLPGAVPSYDELCWRLFGHGDWRARTGRKDEGRSMKDEGRGR